jgi:hypothetical protein
MNSMVRFEAPWDAGLTAITVSALAFTVVVIGTISVIAIRAGNPAVLGVVALSTIPCLVGVGLCYWWAPRAFSVDDTAVRIERPAGSVVLPLASIQRIETLEDHRTLRRVFGSGGLFGYYGTYREAALGDVKLYATRRAGRVILATSTGPVVLTPDVPDSFVSEVRRRLGLGG